VVSTVPAGAVLSGILIGIVENLGSELRIVRRPPSLKQCVALVVLVIVLVVAAHWPIRNISEWRECERASVAASGKGGLRYPPEACG